MVTASARNLPAFTSGTVGGMLTMKTASWPATTSVSAGARTLVRHVLDVDAGHRLEELHRHVRAAAVAARRVRRAGRACAFAYAMNSGIVVRGQLSGLMTKMFGATATWLHRREVALDVVGQLGVHGGVDAVRARVAHDQRVAVGRAPSRRTPTPRRRPRRACCRRRPAGRAPSTACRRRAARSRRARRRACSARRCWIGFVGIRPAPREPASAVQTTAAPQRISARFITLSFHSRTLDRDLSRPSRRTSSRRRPT